MIVQRGYMKNTFYAATMTLYDKDFQIDKSRMHDYIAFLIDKGVEGFFTCGTTGEYVGHTKEENLELLKITLEENQGKKDIIYCASTSTYYQTMSLIEEIARLGVEKVSICPPYYAPLTQGDVIAYYNRIIANIKLNIYLYNIPAFTNPISFETFQTLVDKPGIVGIKDSSGNMKVISKYLYGVESNSDFQVLIGTDEMILPALSLGCYGSVSALGGIIPEVLKALYENYNKDLAYSQKLQDIITKIALKCESIIFPVGYKLALAARGFEVNGVRQHITLSDSKIDELKADIKSDIEHALKLVRDHSLKA